MSQNCPPLPSRIHVLARDRHVPAAVWSASVGRFLSQTRLGVRSALATLPPAARPSGAPSTPSRVTLRNAHLTSELQTLPRPAAARGRTGPRGGGWLLGRASCHHGRSRTAAAAWAPRGSGLGFLSRAAAPGRPLLHTSASRQALSPAGPPLSVPRRPVPATATRGPPP